MHVRVAFGFLFFLLSVIFCAIQLISLPAADHLEATRMALQFGSVLVCLVLASLAAQCDHKTVMMAISVIAFSVCFLALLSSGILAIKGTSEMAPIKYVIFLAYAGLYGIFGITFSLLAGRPANNEAGKTN